MEFSCSLVEYRVTESLGSAAMICLCFKRRTDVEACDCLNQQSHTGILRLHGRGICVTQTFTGFVPFREW